MHKLTRTSMGVDSAIIPSRANPEMIKQFFLAHPSCQIAPDADGHIIFSGPISGLASGIRKRAVVIINRIKDSSEYKIITVTTTKLEDELRNFSARRCWLMNKSSLALVLKVASQNIQPSNN